MDMVGPGTEFVTKIRGRGFIGGLPDEILGRILEHTQVTHHSAGSIALRSEDESEPAAIVAAGLLRIYVVAPDGRQMTLRFARPGDLVGLARIHGDGGTQAVEPSALLHLDPGRLLRVAAEEPRLSLALAEEARARSSQAYQAAALRIFGTVRSRVALDLCERLSADGGVRSGARVRVTHQQLADSVGSVREVVARAARELREAGIVANAHGGLEVVDPRALRAEAGLVGKPGEVQLGGPPHL